MQAVPTNAKAITRWENRDEAWAVVANSLRLTVQVVIERVQARLQEQRRRELPVEASVCFVFDTEDPEEIEKRKQAAYAWARQNRADRDKALDAIEQKVAAIQGQVFGHSSSADRELYKSWYGYLTST